MSEFQVTHLAVVANPGLRDVRNPSLADILTEIRSRRSLSLEGPGASIDFVVVGKDWFVSALIVSEHTDYALIQDEPCEGWVEIAFEQHVDRFSKRVLVSEAMALSAAEYFFHHGKRNPQQTWEFCVDMMPDDAEEP